jgi:hypothetical protein
MEKSEVDRKSIWIPFYFVVCRSGHYHLSGFSAQSSQSGIKIKGVFFGNKYAESSGFEKSSKP